jgi:hypothetical protein
MTRDAVTETVALLGGEPRLLTQRERDDLYALRRRVDHCLAFDRILAHGAVASPRPMTPNPPITIPEMTA